MEPNNPDQSKPLETLLGYAEHEVTYEDGTKETIRVRQLPVRLFVKAAALVDDENAALDLICDKPSGWSCKLHPDSFVLLVAEAERVNASFFRFAEERQRKHMQIMAQAASKLEPALIALIAKVGAGQSFPSNDMLPGWPSNRG